MVTGKMDVRGVTVPEFRTLRKTKTVEEVEEIE